MTPVPGMTFVDVNAIPAVSLCVDGKTAVPNVSREGAPVEVEAKVDCGPFTVIV